MMGVPEISMSELLSEDGEGDVLSTDEAVLGCLRGDVVDLNSIMAPVLRGWPMGLSWSCHVEQATMLWSLFQSGVCEEQSWTAERSLPAAGKDQYSVCTDDVLCCRRASHIEAAATPTAVL